MSDAQATNVQILSGERGHEWVRWHRPSWIPSALFWCHRCSSWAIALGRAKFRGLIREIGRSTKPRTLWLYTTPRDMLWPSNPWVPTDFVARPIECDESKFPNLRVPAALESAFQNSQSAEPEGAIDRVKTREQVIVEKALVVEITTRLVKRMCEVLEGPVTSVGIPVEPQQAKVLLAELRRYAEKLQVLETDADCSDLFLRGPA